MGRYEYFKGHRNLENGGSYRCIYRFDSEYKPEETIFADGSIEVYTLEKAAIRHFQNNEELTSAGYYVAREISENEFYAYRSIAQLLDEIYLNQFTGGFPRENTVNKILCSLPITVNKAMKEIKDNMNM